MSTDQIDQYRRRFLAGSAAAGTAMVAPGVFLSSVAHAGRDPSQPVTDEVRWGMLIDTTKCATGCDACVKGCNEEHGLTGHGRPETDAQWIRKAELKDKMTGTVTSLPLLCQHCEHPPCVDVCPTGASFKRADGIVLVDKHICIGCRYCMMACPYKARSFVHETLHDQSVHAPRGKGTVESCTFCVHRVDKDHKNAIPACAEACSAEGHDALTFGDLKDPNSKLHKKLTEISHRQIRADMGLNPGVQYHGI